MNPEGRTTISSLETGFSQLEEEQKEEDEFLPALSGCGCRLKGPDAQRWESHYESLLIRIQAHFCRASALGDLRLVPTVRQLSVRH